MLTRRDEALRDFLLAREPDRDAAAVIASSLRYGSSRRGCPAEWKSMSSVAPATVDGS